MPIKANESVTLPAVVIRKGDSQAEHTTLTIDGTWTHTLAALLHQSFAGKIQIEMLEYTHKEDTWNLDFQVIVFCQVKIPGFAKANSLVLPREFPGNCQINSLVLPRYFTRMRALRRR